MIKGCIFDFDGVITDTEKYHLLAWQEVASVIGTTFSFDEYQPLKSTGRPVILHYLFEKAHIPFDEKLYEKLCNVKGEAYSRLTRSVSRDDLINGVEDFLRLLANNGYLLAVASSSSAAENLLISMKLNDLFDVIIDGKEKIAKKPDPSIFLLTAKKLGLSPKNCVVFEDSIAGVTAAKNGGFAVVGIGKFLSDYGINTIEDFSDASLKTVSI